MKYVAFRRKDDGEFMGFTTLDNFNRYRTTLFNEHEDVIEFEGPEYDSSDEMFDAVKNMASEACKTYRP